MTTELTLDTPQAQAALGRCYALIRKWASESRKPEAADRGNLDNNTPAEPVKEPEEVEQ